MADPVEPSPPGAPSLAIGGVERRGAEAGIDASTRARLLLFASAVLFGLAAVLARVATLAGMSGGQATLGRFAVGLTVVVGIFVARPGTFRPARPWLLAARGGFGGFAALLYFLSIERIPAGEATLLNNTFPIFAVLVSLFVLGERPTVHLALALALASAGVFLVLGGGHVTFGLGPGEVLGIVSAAAGGLAVTAIRALRSTHNAATVFFSFALGGLLVSIPYGFAPWPTSPLAWVATLAVGVVAFLAQLSMTEAYGALSVPEAALWQQLTPIASYLWALTLGEQIGWPIVVGVLLGVIGVVYGSVLGHRPSVAGSEKARMAAGIPSEEP